jgi:NAD(P)H dehydrogenase (quinone)
MAYAITGITGKVGGEVARTLLGAGQSVRAVMRDDKKASAWADQGCAVAIAEMTDAAALTAAFSGTDGVFVLLPGNFDPSPGFPELRAILAALEAALLAARPSRVVCISTIGAQATTENLLTQLGIMEQTLGELPLPITFLRPAWFMENCSWDVAPARQSGVIPSFLQPLDKPFPMVASADVARRAARLLQETWSGRRVVELEGPTRVSPNDVAATFSRVIGEPVRVNAVPRETWRGLFQAQGMKNPTPRIRMLDGFNEGWIEFESGAAGTVKGTTPLEAVVNALIATT